MDSEKTPPVETPAAENAAPTSSEPRRTSRRQEIRAALLAVPMVLTLATSARAHRRDGGVQTQATTYNGYVNQGG